MRLITDRWKRVLEKNVREERARRLIMIAQTAYTTLLHLRGEQTRYPPFKREFVICKIATT